MKRFSFWRCLKLLWWNLLDTHNFFPPFFRWKRLNFICEQSPSKLKGSFERSVVLGGYVVTDFLTTSFLIKSTLHSNKQSRCAVLLSIDLEILFFCSFSGSCCVSHDYDDFIYNFLSAFFVYRKKVKIYISRFLLWFFY